MIHYQLRCASGHEFDGWFKTSASFDRQAARGMLECPRCGMNEVSRALMAPRIGGKSHEPIAPAAQKAAELEPAATEQKSGTAVAGRMPDELRAMLARLRTEVEARCDYVGGDFATEARRIHDGSAPKRGIYGEASEADAESLAEDGIDVARIPWVPRADS
ncbi:DUF1178 family protein [Acidiphilium sp. AL]|uniref:DUF1178 family protein n=1 Tax=Acidiphilium iwatense TaxID=768198 RepID=A0ABS9E0P4_9PROT|nr:MULTISPECIES: DUF1178 family protein [Acidiphilium]MCF3947913.1 DUF1178 family protein [Acidiphilium iwatense]MCU4161809.1 DUF1178 family protein [Acidiphilium sp. AL]